METRYPIRAVAKLTGLSLDTLRAWERRYQAVAPERSARGRQYGPGHIERLLLLGQLVQKGHAIGGIAALADRELRKLLAQPPGRAAIEVEPSTDLTGPILTAIGRFDQTRAGDELNRLAAALSPRDLVYEVALPLMRDVGIRWHNGTLAIAHEHLVSHLLRNLLGSMTRLFRPSGARFKMVLATPAGEQHEFGILASGMLISIAGIEPIYLGPDLPAGEIAEAARRTSAKAVVLGITVIAENTAKEVRAIATAMPRASEIWIGGASGAHLDLAKLGKKAVLLKDLPSFEIECRRWRSGL